MKHNIEEKLGSFDTIERGTEERQDHSKGNRYRPCKAFGDRQMPCTRFIPSSYDEKPENKRPEGSPSTWIHGVLPL